MISRKVIGSFLRTPSIDQDLEEKIQTCEDLIQTQVKARWVRKLEKEVAYFNQAPSLQSLMEDAEVLVFLGLTLGQEAEVLLRRVQLKDPGLGYVLDGVLSAYVEDRLDAIQRKDQEQSSLYVTDRYSPGYGDIPHSLQRDFAKTLNIYKTLGLSLSKADLLIPRKSVLAVYGKTKEKPNYRDACAFCSQVVCKDRGKARCRQ